MIPGRPVFVPARQVTPTGILPEVLINLRLIEEIIGDGEGNQAVIAGRRYTVRKDLRDIIDVIGGAE